MRPIDVQKCHAQITVATMGEENGAGEERRARQIRSDNKTETEYQPGPVTHETV